MRVGDSDFDRAVDVTTHFLGEVAARDDADPRAFVTYGDLSAFLAQHGLDVPAHGGPMPYVLEEASVRAANDGKGLISALVVERETRRPSQGFFRMARQSRFGRRGSDEALWLAEVRRLRGEAAERPAVAREL